MRKTCSAGCPMSDAYFFLFQLLLFAIVSYINCTTSHHPLLHLFFVHIRPFVVANLLKPHASISLNSNAFFAIT
ncbi:hypothetical protein GQ54DRAFT_117512 [Martensiomyces pterosporus]|nr:hypothetical protein GQ54DRAFT_117512 [Martensiomyces pterosporus]